MVSAVHSKGAVHSICFFFKYFTVNWKYFFIGGEDNADFISLRTVVFLPCISLQRLLFPPLSIASFQPICSENSPVNVNKGSHKCNQTIHYVELKLPVTKVPGLTLHCCNVAFFPPRPLKVCVAFVSSKNQ